MRPRTRFLYFGGVSVLTTLLDFGVFNVLISSTAVPTAMANTISYALGIVASYEMNRRYTFRQARGDARRRQIALFVAFNLFGLALNNVAVTAAESAFSGSALMLNGAKLAAGAATWVLKFMLFSRWVYTATTSAGEGLHVSSDDGSVDAMLRR